MKLASEIVEEVIVEMLNNPADALPMKDQLISIVAAKLEPVRDACQKMVRYADGAFDEQEIGDAGDMFAEAMAAIRSILVTLSEEE